MQEDAYYSEFLDQCYELGYIKGVTQNTFQPQTALSRGMLVTIVHRYAGEPETAAETPFTDIGEDTYYIPALNWAYAQGLVQGVSPTKFAPNDAVTRQQAVTIFHRFVQMCNGDNGLREHTAFPDEAAISQYALDAAHWSAANEIIIGDERGYFVPTAPATRAQSVTILMRLDGYLQTADQEEALP